MFRDSEVLRMKQKDLFGCKAAIEVVNLRHHADASLDGNRIVRDVDTFNAGNPGSGQHPRRQDSDGGCLAGAVWPQQSKKFAARYFERDTVERFNFESLARLGL